MLGPPKPCRLSEPIAVSLEELIPASHFYRHLEARLELSFVRDWTREQYAERGRPSIDPVVFFNLQVEDAGIGAGAGTPAVLGLGFALAVILFIFAAFAVVFVSVFVSVFAVLAGFALPGASLKEAGQRAGGQERPNAARREPVDPRTRVSRSKV